MNELKPAASAGLFALALLLAACGGTGSSRLECPYDRVALGGKCVCASGVEIDGKCVSADEDEADYVEDSAALEYDEDGGEYEDGTPESPDEDDAAEEGAEGGEGERETAEFTFAQPQILYHTRKVWDAKLSSFGVILFASNRLDETLPRYDILGVKTTGGKEWFVGNVTWDFSPQYDWLPFEFTPDGKSVVYSNDFSSVSNLYISSVEGGTPQFITDYCYPMRWAVSDDGKYIAYGIGAPDENGLIRYLFSRRLDLSDDSHKVGKNVVPESFRFVKGSDLLVYGQGASAYDYSLYVVNYASTSGGMAASGVSSPFFKLAADASGVFYQSYKAGSPDCVELRFLSLKNYENSILAFIFWPKSRFVPSICDVLSSQNYAVVYAEPTGADFRYSSAGLSGAYNGAVASGMRRDAVMSPDGSVLFVRDGAGALYAADALNGGSALVTTYAAPDARIFFSDKGRFALFKVVLPDLFLQSGKSFVAAYDLTNKKTYLLAPAPDGCAIMMSESGGSVYYVNVDGNLVSVAADFKYALD